MHKLMRRLAVFGVLLTLAATVAGSAAAHEFSGLTTTAGGYETWDSDQINVENVSETGKGVYVAVLDTGMVPNYKDYFPGGARAHRSRDGLRPAGELHRAAPTVAS